MRIVFDWSKQNDSNDIWYGVSVDADPATMPGTSGDSTADIVLGQRDFGHGGANYVDGAGLQVGLTSDEQQRTLSC